MANRFPLIVNPISKKIEELIASDNLDLTGSGIYAGGSVGTAGQYLKSNGTTVLWDTPGDVYLTATQTLTNKTIESSFLSGTTNTFTNIPNGALVNSSITVNGTAIALGGSVTTPDNNTTYSIAAVDGGNAATKIVRLTSGGNSGAGVDDDISFVAGTNVTLTRSGDAITINSSYIDTNTVTRIQASGGNLVSGDVTFAVSGNAAGISQVGNTITIAANYVNTVTRLRGTATGTYTSGDLQLLAGSNVTINQSVGTPTDITISSQDTVTRLRGRTSNPLVSGDITLEQGSNVSITQSGSTITIASTDTNTVTSVKANSEADGNAVTGIINFTSSNAATVTRIGNTINISATDNDTTYTASSTGGLNLTTTTFSLKNVGNFTGNRIQKWDSTNNQFTNSTITDDGTTVTIGGNLTVTGTTTTVDSTTVLVADNEIELRKGNNLVGTNSGLRVNRTTNGTGVVQTWVALQWFESGGYWRSFDNGGVANRFVTETETQTLTNKTLTSPTLTTPVLGAATATTLNGLTITSTIGGTLTVSNSKTLTVNSNVSLTAADGSGPISVLFGAGGSVAYTGNGLGQFATTSSLTLRTVIDDETGQGSLVFNQTPKFSQSIGLVDGETIIDVFNTTALTVNLGGAATSIIMGSAASGTTTIRHNLTVNGNVTLGDANTDTVSVTGPASFGRDISIQSIGVGRGNNNVQTNTRVGEATLTAIVGGSQNTVVGYEAGKVITSGAANTLMGHQAGVAILGGQNNVALGKSALSTNSTGNKNVAVGVSALAQVSATNSNVAVGHFAGNGVTGNGNVLIGPADNENSGDATFAPTTPGGDRQLVIGSGTGTWVRGDSSFNVSVPKDLGVGGNVSISGTLTVNGTVTTIDSVRLRVDDKNIEIGDVQGRSFTGTFNNNTNIITLGTGVTTENIIPGMVITTITSGVTIPANTTVTAVVAGQVTISNNISSTGNLSASFNVAGPSDTTADGGGITLKGTTDKTITWLNSTQAWTVSEHLNLAVGKNYRLNGQDFATSQFVQLPVGSSFARPATPALGMVRFNTTTQGFEGYGLIGWAPIGGGSEVQTYEIDDITTAVDGQENTFTPRLNYEKITVTNPFGLLITVNGIIQSAYINNTDVVNQSHFLGARDGYTVDYDGNIKFTESIPLGSDVFARVVAAAITPAQQKTYPFSPSELLLGYT
jgi:hypothetical protein